MKGYFYIDRFAFILNNDLGSNTPFWREEMEPRRDDEISRLPSGDLLSRQFATTISSLNEAWFHTLDK